MGKKSKDITGQIFGNWKAIKRDNTKNKVYWICECQCEYKTLCSFRMNHLTEGSMSDKCLKCKEEERINKEEMNSLRVMENKENEYKKLINQQFGNLIVKSFYGRNKIGSLLWLCECQCDNKNKVICSSTDLTKGKKDNCGCLTSKKMSDSKRKYNTYNITGEYGVGYTNKGDEFYFDLEDYELIKNYCWIKHDGYIEANSLFYNDNKNIKMHRLVMEVTDEKIKVDHIFHKLYDNRKSQLRKSSNAENCANHVLHSNNTSGKSGVNFREDTGKWRVRIWKDLKCYNLGQFDNFDDAVVVRDNAEIKHFKEFRCEEEKLYE